MSSATRRLRPFRTTAFKLAAGYLVVFGVFAIGLIGYLVFETSSVLMRDVDRRLTNEAQRLGVHYRQEGINGLFVAMQESTRRPSNRLYALRTPTGEVVINTVGEVPQGVWEEPGLARFFYDQQGWNGSSRESLAIVRIIELSDGFTALIGLDIGQSHVIRQTIGRSFVVSTVLLILLAVLGWLYVNKRVLKRLDGFSQTTARIMDGELSQRLAVVGNGDEFDRLADQLNVMLERLERSMNRLKEVSDNIAHDLRTPLTRMRNQMEDALRQPPDAQTDRAALENSLDEAERLMATFQALLTIARVEAGGRRHTLARTELGQVLTDVIELYEPVAEDKGVSLVFQRPQTPIYASVNRELIGLALANLIDNALKYGASTGGRIELALAEDNESVLASVADDGPGIAEAERRRVTERFVRLDKSRTAEGSGLGLALVDAVAAFHDGSLDLSDAEPGLKAMLRLPVGTQADDESAGA
ncbi:MAG: ATP-binding protein [Pseudomonadota bacterium]